MHLRSSVAMHTGCGDHAEQVGLHDDASWEQMGFDNGVHAKQVGIDGGAHGEQAGPDNGAHQAIRKRWNVGTAFRGQKDFVRPTRHFFGAVM